MLPWESMADGARQKTAVRGPKRIRLLELSDSFIEPDWCTRGHTGCVLDGRLEITFENRVEQFGIGDGLLIQGGENHKARGLSGRVLLLIVEDL